MGSLGRATKEHEKSRTSSTVRAPSRPFWVTENVCRGEEFGSALQSKGLPSHESRRRWRPIRCTIARAPNSPIV